MADDFRPWLLRRQVARGFEPAAHIRALKSLGLLAPLLKLLGRVPQGEPAELWPDIEASLHSDLDGEVAALLELVPEIDLELWPNFRRNGGHHRS